MGRCLQEEERPERGGGATFPGDDWLTGLKENMDYSVQIDRCDEGSPAVTPPAVHATALFLCVAPLICCGRQLIGANQQVRRGIASRYPPLVVEQSSVESRHDLRLLRY